MVIMDNFYLQDKMNELWNNIDKLHLKYLDMEESTEKIEIRLDLEELIKEYLCLASHEQKFILPITYEILYRSAKNKVEFSAYKAATGFNTIQIYAGNLLSQPWRREYKQIKKYSGFYKHHLESNLINAELLLEAMGYKSVGVSTMILDGPIGPDKVLSVSRDCLVAYVECQIVKVIWEELTSNNFDISWLEILEFRRTHLCSPEQSIKSLKYHCQQKHFQDHMKVVSQGPSSSYLDQTFPPVLPPQQYLFGQSSCCQSTVRGPCMSVNAQNMHHPSHHPPYVTYVIPPGITMSNDMMMKPQFNTNGYYYANNGYVNNNNLHHQQHMSTVPIAQLIEVEPHHNGYNNDIDRSCHPVRTNQRLNNVNNQDFYVNYSVDNGEENRDSDKTNESQFENWEYVYRKLENEGYNKDLGERGDVLSSSMVDGKTKREPKTLENKKKKEKESMRKSKGSTVDLMVVNNVASTSVPVKQKVRTPNEKNNSSSKSASFRKSSQAEVSPSSSYDNVSVENERKIKVLSNNKSFTNDNPVIKTGQVDKNNIKLSLSTNRNGEKSSKPVGSSWECKFCTFINVKSNNICEMCSRTRSNVEKEIEVGGAECEQCTLVNPKDAKNCQACNQSLENSPTRV